MRVLPWVLLWYAGRLCRAEHGCRVLFPAGAGYCFLRRFHLYWPAWAEAAQGTVACAAFICIAPHGRRRRRVLLPALLSSVCSGQRRHVRQWNVVDFHLRECGRLPVGVTACGGRCPRWYCHLLGLYSWGTRSSLCRLPPSLSCAPRHMQRSVCAPRRMEVCVCVRPAFGRHAPRPPHAVCLRANGNSISNPHCSSSMHSVCIHVCVLLRHLHL